MVTRVNQFVLPDQKFHQGNSLLLQNNNMFPVRISGHSDWPMRAAPGSKSG
jgi:hypothetical protein